MRRLADLGLGTKIVAEVAAASGEQSSGIEQVNRAVTQTDTVVQGNAAQTEELSSTAHALAAHAGELQSLVGRFRVQAAETPPAILRPSTPAQPAATPRRARGRGIEGCADTASQRQAGERRRRRRCGHEFGQRPQSSRRL